MAAVCAVQSAALSAQQRRPTTPLRNAFLAGSKPQFTGRPMPAFQQQQQPSSSRRVTAMAAKGARRGDWDAAMGSRLAGWCSRMTDGCRRQRQWH